MNRTEFRDALISGGKYESIAPVAEWSTGVNNNRPTHKNGNPVLDADGNQVLSDHEWRIKNLGASLYVICVIEKSTIDGQIRTKTGHLFVTVFDPDGPGETVEWEEHGDRLFLPEAPDNVFKDAVVAWYAANKPASVAKFEIVETNKDLQFAVARVFDVSAGVATEKRVFIYKDGAAISVADLA